MRDPMKKHPPIAESLLALFAGRERATAIYGDLLELAATQGRVSFLRAYISTLVSLSWRPLAAFFIGAIVFAFLFDCLTFPMFFFFAFENPGLGDAFGYASLQLCFLLPFAVVRYGVRDRAVQLIFFAVLVAAGIWAVWGYSIYWPVAALLVVICAVVAIRFWRYSMPLVASCAAGAAILASLDHAGNLDPIIGHLYWAVPGLHDQFPVLPALFDMLVISIVFSQVHRRVNRPRLAEATRA